MLRYSCSDAPQQDEADSERPLCRRRHCAFPVANLRDPEGVRGGGPVEQAQGGLIRREVALRTAGIGFGPAVYGPAVTSDSPPPCDLGTAEGVRSSSVG